VSEAFVQTLADLTGGACELVSPREDMAEKPREDMAEKVVRHFKRIYFPKAENVTINWPCKPVKMFPEQVNTIYDGDTLHAFARFKEKPNCNVMLTAKLENGETLTQSLPVHQSSYSKNKDDLPSAIARMAAASEIKSLISAEETAQIAVKYQLMSRYTNYLTIDVKADGKKAQMLPALRKTPQMLAAGWGGTGAMVSEIKAEYGVPMFSKRHGPESIKLYSTKSLAEVKRRSIINFIHAMNRLHSGFFHRALKVASLQDMKAHGVPEDIIEDLTELKESGIEEYVIMVVFLYLLTQQKRFKKQMSRSLRRIITKAYKQLPEFQNEIARKIEEIIV
jgi:Ca-activated chloride channel family protein